MGELQDKVSLVTGGARGIGKAIAMELVRQGSHIIISDIDISGTDELIGEAEAMGVRALAVQVDVTKADEVGMLMDNVINKFEHIDILVNNAGITRDNLLMRMSEADWDLVLEVNLKGAFLCTQKVIRSMMKQRSGKIINISSVIGIMGNAGQSNYAASKAGLIGFTKSIAKEVASRNIQVNGIAPGYIETDMTANFTEETRASYIASIPANRSGAPSDVAKVVGFLASPSADYITGQILNVDGGLLMD